MTNSSQPAEPSGDYSYDLVHEEVQLTHGETGQTARSAPASVRTQTPEETNGDYSYDMAHDIPAGET